MIDRNHPFVFNSDITSVKQLDNSVAFQDIMRIISERRNVILDDLSIVADLQALGHLQGELATLDFFLSLRARMEAHIEQDTLPE